MMDADELNQLTNRIQEVKERRKNKKIFCYQCQGETKQKELLERVEIIPPKELIFYDANGTRQESVWTIEAQVWRVTECLGCERMNLNVYSRHSPAEDDVLVHHFPTKGFRSFPIWATHLNQKYVELFMEVYSSLNTGNIRLPLMGARTLLDLYIVDKIGDVGTFKQKLERLVNEKHISESAKDILRVEFFGAISQEMYSIETGQTDNMQKDVIDLYNKLGPEKFMKARLKVYEKNIESIKLQDGSNALQHYKKELESKSDGK